jgi:DNA-binding transcriptional ArsR family regulator
MKMPRRPPPACCPPQALKIRKVPRLVATTEHVAAFKALAHRGRLQVFFHLANAGEAQAVNDIQAALGLPGPTLSHHLQQLEKVGLIERVRDERFIRSTVRRELVTDLVRLLTACC